MGHIRPMMEWNISDISSCENMQVDRLMDTISMAEGLFFFCFLKGGTMKCNFCLSAFKRTPAYMSSCVINTLTSVQSDPSSESLITSCSWLVVFKTLLACMKSCHKGHVTCMQWDPTLCQIVCNMTGSFLLIFTSFLTSHDLNFLYVPTHNKFK